ncbi:MAG: HEAT repeat domain-containing protein [Acidobacteriia bacterium]|nr:HEAT repeat domain-containing protein [Terriglobia bacterium]
MDMPPNSPTPDYGMLGPGSDIKLPAGAGFGPSAPTAKPPLPAQLVAPSARIVMALVSVTMTLGMFFYAQSMLSKARSAASELRSTSPARSSSTLRGPAQKDAEQLLQRAAANDAAATAQIEARAATWRGQIALTPQLSRLITVGLNANDLRVRAATIQLDLAAMNVAQDAAAVDRLAAQAESTDHATRIWAIWTLGLVANRGIQQERITDLLIAHLADSDIDSRHWAVEALSYVGTDATIPPLLKTMHDDPSPTIRERAACALAESGMLTNQQRRTTIPTLLTYAEDPSLDAQTHAWTYHALRDITAQNLPDDAGTWRNWYSSNR